ncbi:hypothetical protein GYH30_048875 [Glycine max]|uniref:Uncharacterized protein n=1 Tax=Glycine max TaxID=3847 RepID=A0A0R0EW32_SOYBN|nr:hypothetical protein GYH30_048875 [Glycine max]
MMVIHVHYYKQKKMIHTHTHTNETHVREPHKIEPSKLAWLDCLNLKPTHFPSQERKGGYSVIIPSTSNQYSSEVEVWVILPLQLEEASKGIALIPNPSFNIFLSSHSIILIYLGSCYPFGFLL